MGYRKTVLRGKFLAINACIKKEEGFQINNITLYLKEPKQEQIKPKASGRKGMIKIKLG